MATESATATATDTWLGLGEAARLCPSTRRRKPVHPGTLSRWILKGVPLQSSERLKFSGRRFPGGWATTREALNEFIDGLTADRQGEPVALPPPRLQLARQRAHDRAEAELARSGI
jgi:hypothetical protein